MELEAIVTDVPVFNHCDTGPQLEPVWLWASFRCSCRTWKDWRDMIKFASGITGHAIHWPDPKRLKACDGDSKPKERPAYGRAGGPLSELHESRQNALENATFETLNCARELMKDINQRAHINRPLTLRESQKLLKVTAIYDALVREYPRKPAYSGVHASHHFFTP